jgi:hypothetical protein
MDVCTTSEGEMATVVGFGEKALQSAFDFWTVLLEGAVARCEDCQFAWHVLVRFTEPWWTSYLRVLCHVVKLRRIVKHVPGKPAREGHVYVCAVTQRTRGTCTTFTSCLLI